MSYHPIVVGASTWNSSGPGRYVLSTSTFGGPLDFWRISGGSYNPKTKRTNASISRTVQKNVTVNSVTTQTELVVTVNIAATAGATVADMDTVFTDLSTLVTTAFLDRLLNGES